MFLHAVLGYDSTSKQYAVVLEKVKVLYILEKMNSSENAQKYLIITLGQLRMKELKKWERLL